MAHRMHFDWETSEDTRGARGQSTYLEVNLEHFCKWRDAMGNVPCYLCATSLVDEPVMESPQ